jgi:DNA polymerase-4
VRVEVGLPISIGVARTKHLAKIASQVAKPDGLVVVDPDTELAFLFRRVRMARRLPRVWHTYG